MGRGAGFETPDAALVAMPNGMPPALLVVRFDIRCDGGDFRRLALEDFCSLLDVPARAKYDGAIERMGRALRSVPTAPVEDLELPFRRALFAWLIGDGDMHLKNVAIRRITPPTGRRFSAVRLAPLYDCVSTRLFPGLEHDRRALKLNGRDARLTVDDFRALAATLELGSSRAMSLLHQMAGDVAAWADQLRLPLTFASNPDAGKVAARLTDLVRERADPFV